MPRLTLVLNSRFANLNFESIVIVLEVMGWIGRWSAIFKFSRIGRYSSGVVVLLSRRQKARSPESFDDLSIALEVL